MLTTNMNFVCEHADSLDLQISADQADECSSAYLQERRLSYDHTVIPNYVPEMRQETVGA